MFLIGEVPLQLYLRETFKRVRAITGLCASEDPHLQVLIRNTHPPE